MIEISVIRDGQVVWDKEFKGYNEQIEILKTKVPDRQKMIDMEQKFFELVSTDKDVSKYYKIAGALSISILTNTTFAYADSLGDVGDKIKVITNPIIELLAGLGYPAAYGMIITGMLMVIMGKKNAGIRILKLACIGFLGLQFAPFILSLLEMIGRELRNSL